MSLKSLIALMAAAIATCVILVLTQRSLNARSESVEAAARATTVRNELNQIMLLMEHAESGHRGYLHTGDPSYLRGPELAGASVPGRLAHLERLVAFDPEQRRGVEAIGPLARTRLDEIDATIKLWAAGDREGALRKFRTGRGLPVMDQLRRVAAETLDAVAADVDGETEGWETSVERSSYVVFGGSGVLLSMLLMVGWLGSRDHRRISAETWVRRLQLELSARAQSDVRLGSLGQRVLDVIVPNLDAHAAALYVNEPTGLRRIAGHALPADTSTQFAPGEGLVGQAALEARLIHVERVPASYFSITSALGSGKPRTVVIAPMTVDARVQGVLELAFLHDVPALDLDAVGRIGETIASALRTARDRTRLEALLEETQRQTEELQAQQEELRAANDGLQKSQIELQNQQTQVEEINARLEEQSASLAHQRDDLVRVGAQLERSNQYKSQFLANMSHELRTPLNSSLILAKLLADNREGNLSEEQIQFASTIYDAGNDLLTLINDILDLSKIEAGMLDVRSEPLLVARLADELRDTFVPVATQKQLAFHIEIAPNAPESIATDHTRLQQILRNLTSNALKFTERGGVTLAIGCDRDRITFTVRDTGIGIPEDQREMIFEPFCQVDGGPTRRFGGTGLGLSISRDLARLLGGELELASTPGHGSTFTLTLPLQISSRVPSRTKGNWHAKQPTGTTTTTTTTTTATTTPPPPPPDPTPQLFPDDRARIISGCRSLLVIEDDPAFARVLYDLGRELQFEVAVAATGAAGLALARELQPSAIVLDVGLPDRSGLSVLDSLKRDPRTRHLPVHVISVHDYTRTALEMGATGYALKPIERAELVKAIAKLEARFTRELRRVLVVEDDPVLRDSTARLLAADQVEIVTAGTSAEALSLVRSSTFDCMVLDLALPDGNGLDLLQQMARGEQYSFPPVIVYTGRSLTDEQIRSLEQFSHSIIIKGARSPERLLDEVSLFLHQVEAELPPERQRMLRDVRDREAVFEGRNILIVEDDVRNVFALSAVLEPKGARVKIARNGREALEQLHADPTVDLVLMDIMMPEMDGIEATRRLRADTRFAHLPIIALTAKAMIDDREKCLAAGANDYIAKPLEVDKLLSLARVWIRK